jgi:PAS domain S-box-containing protein
MNSMIDKSYNVSLAVLSVAVAIIGSYVAIEIAQRVRLASGGRRVVWISAGALAMGFAIWSMHFVAMLALHLPAPVWYDATLVSASIVAAVAGSAIAFIIFSRNKPSSWVLALASLFMGFAIASMHYTGMAGLRTNGHIFYDPLIVAASVAVAIVVSFAALAVTRSLISGDEPRSSATLKKVGASALMGLAISGMHYTGMAAAHFSAGVGAWSPGGYLVLGTSELGFVVAVCCVGLLAAALAATQLERATLATRTRFESLLELSPQVVWFSASDGRLTYCNPYWYNYTGLSCDDSLGDKWKSAIHPEDRNAVLDTLSKAIAKGTDYEIELRLKRTDGEYRWFLARGRPILDDNGKLTGWLGIALDIEERKTAEEQAQSANLAKSEFLASMSHELRTPLNAIGGYAELLAMGVRGPLNTQQAQDIARIRRSQQHLLVLINDLLNFAKVDAGQIEYHVTAVPVDDALHDAEALIAPQVLAKGLHYTYKNADKSVAVLADPEKLQQIVLNLLSNAVKFTDQGGSITLSPETNGACVEISVQDTGGGVPSEKLATIFEPFVQAGRRLNQPVQGVGLGLAISQDLARGMNGEIRVRSTVGKGSIFTLSLQRAPLGDLADAAPAANFADLPEIADLPERSQREKPHPQRPQLYQDDDRDYGVR